MPGQRLGMLLKGSPETEIHHEKYTNVLSENVIMRVNVVLAAGPFGYCASVRDDPSGSHDDPFG